MSLTIYGKSPSIRRLYLKLRRLGVTVNRRGRAKYVLRWRHTAPLMFMHKAINTVEAIRAASDKLRALELMAEAGVRVVPFSTRAQELIENGARKILGRNRYHTQGRDIILIDATEDNLIPTKNHYTTFLEGGREYRYHMFRDKVLLASVKMTREGTYTNGDVIRNHQNGRWRQVSCSPKPWLEKQAAAAMKALSLDFGAVDMIFHEHKTYVLEANTAPGLTNMKRVDAYASAIKSFMEVDNAGRAEQVG